MSDQKDKKTDVKPTEEKKTAAAPAKAPPPKKAPPKPKNLTGYGETMWMGYKKYYCLDRRCKFDTLSKKEMEEHVRWARRTGRHR